jgi:hypothetical protein
VTNGRGRNEPALVEQPSSIAIQACAKALARESFLPSTHLQLTCAPKKAAAIRAAVFESRARASTMRQIMISRNGTNIGTKTYILPARQEKQSLKIAKARAIITCNIPMHVELSPNVAELTTCGRRSGGVTASRRPVPE